MPARSTASSSTTCTWPLAESASTAGATLTPGAQRSYLATQGMAQLTPSTVTDRWELEAELDQARVHGLVAEVEEFQLRPASVAAPVHDRTGAVAGAIALSVPAAEFEQRQPHLEHLLRQRADRASTLLADTSPRQ